MEVVRDDETQPAPARESVWRQYTIWRSIALTAIAALVAIGVVLVVQRNDKPTTLLVTVSAKHCPHGPTDCFLLRVPDTDILVRADGYNHVTSTDTSGSVVVRVPRPGKYVVSATTFAARPNELERAVEAVAGEQTPVQLEGALIEASN